MTWWRDGLFLAIGGLAGFALAAVLERSDEEGEADAMELLIKDIRQEAESLMADCTTAEERESVYAQVKESVRNLQFTLQARGDEIIADLQREAEQTPDKETIESDLEERVSAFKEKMASMSAKLDETLTDLAEGPAPAVN
jgi:hypothetical protein